MLVLDIDTRDVKAKMVNVLVSVMKCRFCHKEFGNMIDKIFHEVIEEGCLRR